MHELLAFERRIYELDELQAVFQKAIELLQPYSVHSAVGHVSQMLFVRCVLVDWADRHSGPVDAHGVDCADL